ncbi:MAG: Rrf2 family transcriptional regulator [Treponema sp.]|nr:Rrf2 family transcriptional regulator [Treponema sp.]
MQISRKFTTAVHTLLCISSFSTTRKVTSDFIAASTENITLYDIYRATETDHKPLFGFHNNPSVQCPVGRNIHAVPDQRLAVAQKAFEDNLRGVKLSDLLNDLQHILDQPK